MYIHMCICIQIVIELWHTLIQQKDVYNNLIKHKRRKQTHSALSYV